MGNLILYAAFMTITTAVSLIGWRSALNRRRRQPTIPTSDRPAVIRTRVVQAPDGGTADALRDVLAEIDASETCNPPLTHADAVAAIKYVAVKNGVVL